MSDKKTILVCGFGATGSSAVCDLLQELDNFYVSTEEIRIFSDPDGLVSLQSAIVDNWNPYQSDLAIKRFRLLMQSLVWRRRGSYYNFSYNSIFRKPLLSLVNKYLDQLITVKYKGIWLGISTVKNMILRRLGRYLRLGRPELDDIYVTRAMSKIEFIAITEKFLEEFVGILNDSLSHNNIVLDSGFACLQSSKVLDYLPNTKIIVVTRDPRGIFAEAHKWDFLPNDVNEFVRVQVEIAKKWELAKSQVSSNDVLEVRFEDLVLNYEKEKNIILNFLDVELKNHIFKKKYFVPEVSAKNVFSWRGVLSSRDVEVISKKLNVYLD